MGLPEGAAIATAMLTRKIIEVNGTIVTGPCNYVRRRQWRGFCCGSMRGKGGGAQKGNSVKAFDLGSSGLGVSGYREGRL